MKIINPSYNIESQINGNEILKFIEKCGRVSYKSESLITEDSAKNFVEKIITRGHLSVIEHVSITVRFIIDRGVSHELVRHRLASFTQESTRFCNYGKNKFNNEITFIKPCFCEEESKEWNIWKNAMQQAENYYFEMLNIGMKPEEARSVLPNSLKTEIITTMNLREWKHFFSLRTELAAHPQMREIAVPLQKEFREKIPIIFQ